MKRVLIIEDDEVIRANVVELLEAEGFECVAAPDGKAGVAAALSRAPDVVVCDVMMPVMDGHQVLRALRDYPETASLPFIFLTARAERADVREGMNLGADDYVTKPFSRHELLDSIRTRLRRQEAVAAASGIGADGSRHSDPGAAVVTSPAMRAIHDQAMRVAQSTLSVLLLGETGAGKEVLALAIHRASPRANQPFVPLNCAALAESLLESELFGHEKGAFTGAIQGRPGLFEAADGGTVFLDEVGDLPKSIQVKLLRVLEDRKVMRVGSRSLREVDIRFIAATNRDLEGDIAAGTFRQDLYFRIAGLVLEVPPLRARREEIAPLAARFLDNARRSLGVSRAARISPEAMRLLEAHAWPGNVRELRNAIERAVALCTDEEVRPEHLPKAILEAAGDTADPARPQLDALRTQMRDLERQRITDALDRCGGNQTKAAEALGISRRTLLHRLDELDLPRPRKKSAAPAD
jgi:DNA-binding NtrC family response regulator